jgi:inorganic triphosphatase YgiF
MEIELKLALDPADASRFRRHPVLAGLKPTHLNLRGIYYDTPDFLLTRHRVALRVRRVGYHWVQTVKAAAPAVGALCRRPEWEVQVADKTPDLTVLPAEALALLQGVEAQGLVPVFVSAVRRTTWLLELGGARMEIALDQGEILAGDAMHPISEIELELLDGPTDALFAAALGFLERIPLRIESRSKANNGFRLAGAITMRPRKATWPELDPAQPAGGAWVRLVETALAQLVGNLPGYLEQPDDIEYLHQLRVALRRILGLAHLVESRPDWLPPLRALMDLLNPARDWDVFQHETLPRLALPEDAAFLKQVAATAAAARAAAQTALAAPDFTRAVLNLGRALLAPPELEMTAADWAAHALDTRWSGVNRRAAALRDGQPDEFHRLRIALKKLRYASDSLAVLYGKRGERARTGLEGLQDSLGALNDLAVAERLMHDLAARYPEAAFSAGRVVGRLGAEAAHTASAEHLAKRLAAIKPYWRRRRRKG